MPRPIRANMGNFRERSGTEVNAIDVLPMIMDMMAILEVATCTTLEPAPHTLSKMPMKSFPIGGMSSTSVPSNSSSDSSNCWVTFGPPLPPRWPPRNACDMVYAFLVMLERRILAVCLQAALSVPWWYVSEVVTTLQRQLCERDTFSKNLLCTDR